MKHLVASALVVVTFAGVRADARAMMCSEIFAETSARASVEPIKALWDRLNENGALDAVASEASLIRVLNDEDLPIFQRRLHTVLRKLTERAERGPISTADFLAEVRRVLIVDGMPAAIAEKGIREVRAGDLNSFYRMLGDLSFTEVREMYIGTAKGLDYTADSILGRYVRETGATVRRMNLPNNQTLKPLSQERLVVSVSKETFPLWQKMFSQKSMMGIFGHANMYHAGKVYPHQGPRMEFRALSAGTPLPLVILKTSEGERLHRYMELAVSPKYNAHWVTPLKQPWQLEGYTPQGGYTCCTHWIGNIPIGDKPTAMYELPGPEVYRFWRAAYVVKPAKKAPLQPWTEGGDKELHAIWKAPGYEQLSSVLGVLQRNVKGEFASPGSVIQTLIGEVSPERVPVVFLFSEDHRAEIDDRILLRYERPL